MKSHQSCVLTPIQSSSLSFFSRLWGAPSFWTKIFWNRIGKISLFASPDKTQAALAVLILLQQVSPPNTQSSLRVCRIKLKQDPVVMGSVESVWVAQHFPLQHRFFSRLPTSMAFTEFPLLTIYFSLGEVQNGCTGYKVWLLQNGTGTHMHLQIAQRPRWLQHEKHRVKVTCADLTISLFNAQILILMLITQQSYFLEDPGSSCSQDMHSTNMLTILCFHSIVLSTEPQAGLIAHYSTSAKKVKIISLLKSFSVELTVIAECFKTGNDFGFATPLP